MQPSGFSPYQNKESGKKHSIKFPKLHVGVKKWLLIILSIIIGLFILLYICLGSLRFFANNYLGLTFFQKDYLIVLQNNYEMRPTGGFLTGYGEVSTTMGIPSSISFHNSYEIDTDSYVVPPYPHEDMLKNEWYEGYTFRDANWDPNFPGTAKTLIEFYQKKFPEKDVDGIIVVNFNVVEKLVEKFGGIELNNEKYDKGNLFKEITNSVNDIDRHNEEALMERKDILGELATALSPKIKWHPFKAKSVIQEALNNKDLYFWFKNERMQKKVEKKGWANTLDLPQDSDFIHINLANLGSKKADRYLIKEVYHHVNIRGDIPEITTEIVIRYPGFKNNYADDYKGYLRVYIPGNAEIKSDVLGAEESTEGEFKVISTELVLPANSKTTVSYKYQLPRTLLPNREYNLKLIKQSGDNKRYTVTIESNEDSEISSNDFEVKENRAIWQKIPTGDVSLNLQLLDDISAPYPIEQVFESLNTISIYWNEPIDSSTGNDALNYTIVDTNTTNEDSTDEVTVVYAEVIDASISHLELEGVTKQDLERYSITLKDIRDQSGNSINPNPKNITAVQRIVERKEEIEEVQINEPPSAAFEL